MRSERITKSQQKILTSVKWILIGSLGGAIICCLVLCLFTFIFVKMKTIPNFAIGAISLVSASLGAFFSGYISVKFSKEKGMFYGILSGLFLFFVILLVNITFYSEPFSFSSLIKFISMLLSGAIGGIVGVNK